MAILYDKLVLSRPDFTGKAPGIDKFPGDFKTAPQLVKADVEINADLYDFHATGFYLPAGLEATLKVCGPV